jgi:hypothetical protein
MSTRTRVTLSVQSTRDPDRWYRVATVSPDEAMDALEGRGMHAGAVDCPHERIAIIIDGGEPMPVQGFIDWFYGRQEAGGGEGMSTHTSDITCTDCEETEHFGEFAFPEAVVFICRSCGSVAGARWTGEAAAQSEAAPRRERAPTRRERPATRFEQPHPDRTFEATWTNLDRESSRPSWGARVVVEDGEDVPEGATLLIANKNNTRQARKTAGSTVARFRDRTTGDFIRLVEVR